MPWTAPSPALARAIPDASAPQAIADRAAAVSAGGLPAIAAACHAGSAGPIAASPLRAIASVYGEAPVDTYASRHWVSASSPSPAITAGGHPSSRSGSTTAATATRRSSRNDFLNGVAGPSPVPPCPDSTAFLVASDPSRRSSASPRTASRGRGRGCRGRCPRDGPARPSRSEEPGDRLGRIERAAAADPDHDVRRIGTAGRDGLVDQLGRRFAGDDQSLPGDVRVPQASGDLAPCRRGLERTRAGHEQGATTVGGDQRGQLGPAAGTEDDPWKAGDAERRVRRGRDLEARAGCDVRVPRRRHRGPDQACGEGAASSSTASHRSPWRGSAIIGATRSRQAR